VRRELNLVPRVRRELNLRPRVRREGSLRPRVRRELNLEPRVRRDGNLKPRVRWSRPAGGPPAAAVVGLVAGRTGTIACGACSLLEWV
jgi:hypothetical protein